MNVYKELNRLRVTLKNLTVLVLLTLVFQIGIIIILERLLRKTPFTRSVELLSPTNPSGTASPELNQSLNKILLGKFRDSEKTLLNIFEIRGPIGMFFVRPSVVPAPISVTGFVPTPRNSSEGFLGSLTRRALEVISCDYPEVPRESHRFIPFTIRVGHERKGVTFGVIRSKDLMPSLFSGDVPWWLHPDSRAEAFNGGLNRTEPPKSPLVRHNLMMTNPSKAGILVALKPTDEGRIGTGRNTWKRSDECV